MDLADLRGDAEATAALLELRNGSALIPPKKIKGKELQPRPLSPVSAENHSEASPDPLANEQPPKAEEPKQAREVDLRWLHLTGRRTTRLVTRTPAMTADGREHVIDVKAAKKRTKRNKVRCVRYGYAPWVHLVEVKKRVVSIKPTPPKVETKKRRKKEPAPKELTFIPCPPIPGCAEDGPVGFEEQIQAQYRVLTQYETVDELVTVLDLDTEERIVERRQEIAHQVVTKKQIVETDEADESVLNFLTSDSEVEENIRMM